MRERSAVLITLDTSNRRLVRHRSEVWTIHNDSRMMLMIAKWTENAVLTLRLKPPLLARRLLALFDRFMRKSCSDLLQTADLQDKSAGFSSNWSRL